LSRSDAKSVKVAMRARAKDVLRAQISLARREKSAAITDRLGELLEAIGPQVVMAYLPMRGEVDLVGLIRSLIERGVIVAVPVVDWSNRTQFAARIRSLDGASVRADERGLSVPHPTEPMDLSTIDVIIVPGLAFDREGGRLGRGGGYYDRFLASIPTTPVVGVAFHELVVNRVAMESHDRCVDWLVTDQMAERVSHSA